MTNIDNYNEYSMFVRQCVQQLLQDKKCYCYSENHIKDISDRLFKKYNLEAKISKNECGYTLSIPRKERKRRCMN